MERENFIYSPAARTKTASRILTHLQMRLRYVAASCFKATLFQRIHFPERLMKHSSQHLMHSLPFPFFCIRKMMFLCWSSIALPENHNAWHTRISERPHLRKTKGVTKGVDGSSGLQLVLKHNNLHCVIQNEWLWAASSLFCVTGLIHKMCGKRWWQ